MKDNLPGVSNYVSLEAVREQLELLGHCIPDEVILAYLDSYYRKEALHSSSSSRNSSSSSRHHKTVQPTCCGSWSLDMPSTEAGSNHGYSSSEGSLADQEPRSFRHWKDNALHTAPLR